MKKHALGVVVASLALLTACSGEADVEAEAEEVVAEVEGAEEDAATADDGASTVLLGTVGTPEDPDAFEISLTTEDGEPVTSLPAGDYTIEVVDPSDIHNFHLTGPGVDESTSVPEIEETTLEVTLEEGEYTYTCDPHPPMTGTFEVTA